MSSCQLFRKDNKIEKVLASNNEPSILYKDLVSYVKKTGADKIIQQIPYLQVALQNGSILDNSPAEVAVGLWSIAYTEQYQNHITKLGKILPVMDDNAEPLFSIFKNTVLSNDSKFKNPADSYVLSSYKADTVNKAIAKGNALQQKIVEALVVNPDNPVMLEEESHIYYDVNGEEYLSTTTAIKGKMVDPENLYEINRNYGKAFDRLLEGIIKGETYQELKDDPKVVILDESIKKQAFNTLQAYITGLTADGSVVVPQVILSDPQSMIAGSLDILVVKPNGSIKIVDLKVSKNSINNDKYRNTAYPTNTGSLIGGKMTTKQQHGIQLAVYKKLVEIQGFKVSDVESVHILLDLDSNSKKINDFTWEGTEVHSPIQNDTNAKKVIPTEIPSAFRLQELKKELGINNPVNDPEFLTDEEALPEEEIEGDLYDKLYNRVEEIINVLEARKTYFEKLKDSISFRPKKETIEKVNELIVMLSSDLRDGKPNLAYGRFLQYTKTELNKILDFATDPKNKNGKVYAAVLIEADKFVESYRGLIKAQLFGSKDQQNMLIEVLDTLDATKDAIDQGLQEHVQNLYQKNSNKSLTEDELNSILKDVLDISPEDYFLGDISTSTDPLLATIDKIVKNAIQIAKDRTDVAITEIKKAGAELLKASGKSKPDSTFYDFMKVFNKAGKFTGRYVTVIGQQYWDMYYNFKNKLREKNGDTKQYIPITDINLASKEDINYNKQLFIDKQAQRQFLQAEILTSTGSEDGNYHKYTDEFKKIRNAYEEIVFFENADGKIISRWEKKLTVTQEQYDLYKAKYFNKVDYWGAIFEADGQFHGRVELKTGYFPKNEYVEVKEISSDGIDLRDPKYVKLMNPQTALEQAQSQFYKIWTSKMEETLDKLSPSVANQMRGKVARVRGNFMEAMKKNGEGFMSVVGKNLRNFFRADVYTNQRVVDENGNIATGIPVIYVGKLQNEQRVKWLKEELKNLNTKRLNKSITQKEFLKEKKKLSEWLQIEEGKLTGSEIESDMVNNLIAFRTMAENFEAMSNVENDIKAIQKVIEERTYLQQDSIGRTLIQKGTKTTNSAGDPVLKDTNESLTARRLKKYLKMVFYNDEEFNRSTMAMIASRIQNFTSLKGMGLNVFGAVNNYVMGRINNSIEAYGGQHFKTEAAFRATKEFNTDHIPGWFSKLGAMNRGHYSEDKPGSKYEAMVNHFRITRKYQADSGRVDALSWAYIFQEGGEYNVQSKTGIAMLMSEELTNSITGETESIYDAYQYNPNTGELKLKPGYEYTDEQRHKKTNHIYEVNKLIHGNYAFEDRMVIQEHWLGQLAAQFHKWVYPGYKARFKSRYFDQNLGEIEGRYVTVWKLMAYMREAEGNIVDKIRGGWAEMDPIQIANMRKNAAELMFFMASFSMYGLISAIGSGVDDDDENLKKFVNFLQYQSSRQMKEIVTFMPVVGTLEQYQLAKSPIASLGTVKDFGDVLYSVLKMPIPPFEDNYYERGTYKGDLKAWKELKDVTPALNILNKWDAFEQVKSFYIK